MFRLAKSKQEIKSEIRDNWRWIVSQLKWVLIILIAYSILFGVTYDYNITQLSSATSILAMMITPIVLTPVFLGIGFARRGVAYRNAQYGSTPGIDLDEYFKVVLLSILMGFYVMLWSMLFIIPGIIKMIAYSQAVYIYLDSKHAGNEIGYNEAITRSRYLMTGQKFNYFMFSLSFFGWALLSGIVLSMGTDLALMFPAVIGLIVIVLTFVISAIISIWTWLYIAYSHGSYYVQLVNDANADDDSTQSNSQQVNGSWQV